MADSDIDCSSENEADSDEEVEIDREVESEREMFGGGSGCPMTAAKELARAVIFSGIWKLPHVSKKLFKAVLKV